MIADAAAMKNIYAQYQEKFSELPNIQKVLAFACTLFLMGFAFYFFQFSSQLDTVTSLDGQIAAQQNTLASLKAASLKIKSFKEQLAKSQAELDKLKGFLPNEKEIPGLLESLSRLGSYVGLENILFQPEAERRHDFYATIPIRLDLVGTFDNLGVFLDSVSKLDRILKVRSIKLVRQGNDQDQLLSVTCEMVTYRLLRHPAVKKPGPPGRRR